MESILNIWISNRKLHLEVLENHSLDQLNKIPEGFNNNLIWHLGHVVSVQQSLYYRVSGLPMNISDELYATYKPGTRPLSPATQEDVDLIRSLLTSQIEKTQADIAAGIFQAFTPFTTRTGFPLATFHDSASFNNYHEGLHLGYMMSIRKLV